MEPVTPKITSAPLKAKPNLDPAAYAAEVRARRGDVSNMETKLAYYGEHPGWTRRWCNDEGDNIPRRLADGWRFVRPDEVEMSDSVGKGNADIGDRIMFPTRIGMDVVQAILMEIPTELSEELLDARSYSQVRKITASIEAGALAGVTNTRTYIPGDNPASKYFMTRNEITRGGQPT